MTTPDTTNWPKGLEWDDVLDFFPYDTPRDVQTDGMEATMNAAIKDGYTLMEGACGTGKTLIALAPYLSLVRNQNSKFERIVVVTSVKQQQRAFEDEIRRINKNLPQHHSPVSALTLVGKADVCPYVQQDTIDHKAIYGACEDLRENTADLINGGIGGFEKSGSELVKSANNRHANPKNRDEVPDDEPYYVFDQTIPHDEDADEDYCPFYAEHLDRKATDNQNDVDKPTKTIPFDLDTVGLITPENLLSLAGGAGTCPHSVMGEALAQVEVTIANYYHLFEPTTVKTFTKDLIDEKTLVVVDEAHNLVPRVRDLLNRERTLRSFQNAVDETREIAPLFEYDTHDLERIKEVAETHGATAGTYLEDELKDIYGDIEERVGNPETLATSPGEFIELALESHEFIDNLPTSPHQLESWAEFVEAFMDAANKTVEDKFSTFQQKGNEPPYDFDIPLREPRLDTNSSAGEWKDKLASWMGLYPDEENVIKNSRAIGNTIVKLQSRLRKEVLEYEDLPSFSADGIGEFIDQWKNFDETRYFRCIKMERRPTHAQDRNRYDWQEDYGATLTLYNCLPREEIAARLSQFGSGILMSATLVPLHVTRQVTGLDELEANGTPIFEEQYGLSFPEEKRMSYTVDAPAFKYNNKGQAFNYGDTPNLNNDVRETYAQTIFNVVKSTPGNVLVTMPSYSEARWAGELLKQSPEVDSSRVIIDESSTNAQTEEMKQEFFTSDDSILLTGAHGTLTEGIDYKGDRLSAVVCCGVPIENTNNVFSQAVRTAYEMEFGKSNGFEYAFTVPALHKTRQALGRVIRSDDDVGVRVLVDERYTNSDSWDNVREYLSPNEQREYQDVDPDSLLNQLNAFWEYSEQKPVQ